MTSEEARQQERGEDAARLEKIVGDYLDRLNAYRIHSRILYRHIHRYTILPHTDTLIRRYYTLYIDLSAAQYFPTA